MRLRSTSNSIRLLHWNVHSWFDKAGRSNVKRVADLIKRCDVDVVSLVEVDELINEPSPLNEILNATRYHSVFIPAFEYGETRPRGQFGNAILSRLPIHDVRYHQLLSPPPAYDGTESSEPRSLLLANVRGAGGSFWIGSTHLPRADDAARKRAFSRLLVIARRLPQPWLIAGDFNAEPSDWPSLSPDVIVCPSDGTPTYPVGALTEGIDYCIVSGVVVTQAEVLVANGSDHLPLLAQFHVAK